eukprot:1184160-Prorocentrum_minimum.AAC.5
MPTIHVHGVDANSHKATLNKRVLYVNSLMIPVGGGGGQERGGGVRGCESSEAQTAAALCLAFRGGLEGVWRGSGAQKRTDVAPTQSESREGSAGGPEGGPEGVRKADWRAFLWGLAQPITPKKMPGKELLMPRAGFRSFYWSWITLFQALTLEGWTFLLYDAMSFQEATGAFFYISWVFIGNYFLLSLMVSIILDNFEREYKEELKRKEREKHLDEVKKEKGKHSSNKRTCNWLPDATGRQVAPEEEKKGSTSMMPFSDVEHLLHAVNHTVENDDNADNSPTALGPKLSKTEPSGKADASFSSLRVSPRPASPGSPGAALQKLEVSNKMALLAQRLKSGSEANECLDLADTSPPVQTYCPFSFSSFPLTPLRRCNAVATGDPAGALRNAVATAVYPNCHLSPPRQTLEFSLDTL